MQLVKGRSRNESTWNETFRFNNSSQSMQVVDYDGLVKYWWIFMANSAASTNNDECLTVPYPIVVVVWHVTRWPSRGASRQAVAREPTKSHSIDTVLELVLVLGQLRERFFSKQQPRLVFVWHWIAYCKWVLEFEFYAGKGVESQERKNWKKKKNNNNEMKRNRFCLSSF